MPLSGTNRAPVPEILVVTTTEIRDSLEILLGVDGPTSDQDGTVPTGQITATLRPEAEVEAMGTKTDRETVMKDPEISALDQKGYLETEDPLKITDQIV